MLTEHGLQNVLNTVRNALRQHGSDDAAALADLKAKGLLQLAVPSAVDGINASLGQKLQLVAELAKADSPKLAWGFAAHLSAMGLILHSPLPSERRLQLARLGKEQLFCHPLTFSDRAYSGKAAPALQLVAEHAEHGFRLTGSQTFPWAFHHSNFAVVLARPEGSQDDSAIAMVVETDRPGIAFDPEPDTLRTTTPMRATRSGDAAFKGLFVPEDAMLYQIESLSEWLVEAGVHITWPFIGLLLGRVERALGIAETLVQQNPSAPLLKSWNQEILAGLGSATKQFETSRYELLRLAAQLDQEPRQLVPLLAARIEVSNLVQRVRSLCKRPVALLVCLSDDHLGIRAAMERELTLDNMLHPLPAFCGELYGRIQFGLDYNSMFEG